MSTDSLPDASAGRGVAETRPVSWWLRGRAPPIHRRPIIPIYISLYLSLYTTYIYIYTHIHIYIYISYAYTASWMTSSQDTCGREVGGEASTRRARRKDRETCGQPCGGRIAWGWTHFPEHPIALRDFQGSLETSCLRKSFPEQIYARATPISPYSTLRPLEQRVEICLLAH